MEEIKNNHTFSILAYKESPFIEECIISLVNQTVKSDIIICTSTPSDFLFQLSQKYKIGYKINNVSNGIGSDWNFAFENADSTYVTLAHQDDYYDNNYTEECLNSAIKHPRNLIIFTDYNEVINSKSESHRLMLYIKRLLLWPYKFSLELNSVFWKKLIFAFGNPIPCPSVFYNKEKLKDFRFLQNMKTNMDWIAWIELSNTKGSIVCVPKRLTYHRIHLNSETSNTINNNIRELEDEIVFEQIWGKTIANLLMKLYKLSYKSNFSKLTKHK